MQAKKKSSCVGCNISSPEDCILPLTSNHRTTNHLCLVRSQSFLPGLREIKNALLKGVAALDANVCIKILRVLLARILLVA